MDTNGDTVRLLVLGYYDDKRVSDYCHASLAPVKGARGAYTLNLLCDTGEDMLNRDIDTFLVQIEDSGNWAKVVHHGTGWMSNENRECIAYETPFHEATPTGEAIRVMREKVALIQS